MKKAVLLATAFTALGTAGTAAFAQEQGRVLSATPVVQQTAVPRQVCNNQQVVTQGQPSGAGAVMGAIAGGAMGNAIGNGSGRALATMIGLMGGAVVGNIIASFRNNKGDDAYVLVQGSPIYLTTVAGEKMAPVIDRFVIVDYFKSELAEYDGNQVYVPLKYMPKLLTKE